MIVLTTIILLWIAALMTWVLKKVMPASSLRGWLLALFPATSFVLLLWQTVQLNGKALTWSVTWIEVFALDAVLYFDALSALFALLVTGIGTLIIIYAGYYFAHDREAWRFITYLFLFMGMMLGVVVAGDVLTLFIFWEGTSITSFLLVAYKYQYESARQGAFKALFITAGGGIALLLGLLVLSYIAGNTQFTTILTQGDLIRTSELYYVALGLIALGAFTKSAQTPFHIWLPDAMSAPTPASAFLHSATMVKAGIYLLARLNPALGQTEAWFWLLSVIGLLTMFTGAYLGTKQNDLKALLAYSTISQLGILIMLIGQDTEIAFKALVVGIVAHAFYKSALFMLAGTIDLQWGTRELSRLGGLRHTMPFTFVLVAIAALSLAGLPPLFGFLAKETLLATAVHPSLPMFVSWLFAGIIVVAAAFKIVQAGLLTVDGFLSPAKETLTSTNKVSHGMLFAPALPALFSLALGILPEPQALAQFLGDAAAASYGSKVKVSFALWTGLNIPFALSMVAIVGGGVLFWQRQRLIAWQQQFPSWSFNIVYTTLLDSLDHLATLATRLQTGKLRHYLMVILLTTFAWVALFYAGNGFASSLSTTTLTPLHIEFNIVRILALMAVIAGAIATVWIKRDFFAILALGATGLGVAIYMAVEPAPDVALVQIVVDILATVILVLAIGRLPKEQREAAQALNTYFQPYNLLVAVAGGALVTLMSFTALSTRPRVADLATFYAENAKILTGATDIVGAIIVDFRALDTLIEIAVFSLAGLGVYTLLRFAGNKHNDHPHPHPTPTASEFITMGIGGDQASVYLRAITDIFFPIALMISAIHVIYGHDQPGDGFTAGVIVCLAIGLKYVVFGFQETRTRLWWLRPIRLIAWGILLVVINGTVATILNTHFLAPLDYGGMLGLPLPTGMKLSSGFLFEVAIALAVIGSVTLILDNLGRPIWTTIAEMTHPTPTSAHAEPRTGYPTSASARAEQGHDSPDSSVHPPLNQRRST